MKDELRKSLTDLIDETLLELEELKKSRFSASEIEIKGPGEGIAGKPSNGDLHAKAEDKDEDEDEEDEAEKGDGEDPADSEETKRKLKGIMGKAEGQNRQSDPNGGHHKPIAGEGMEHGQGPEHGSHGGKSRDMSGQNSESDPGQTHKVAKADDDEDEDDHPHKDKTAKSAKKIKEEAKDIERTHKSESPSPAQVDRQMRAVAQKAQQESDTLMKSYVDDKVSHLEDKLSTILDLVNKIADQPIAPKGLTGRAVPLMKSNENAGEYLSKGEVASKLFELKKSGTKVDSLDITRAEMGQDLSKIIEKYKIS
jgi:hypothetical protein